jgi:hypothetical protein
MTKLFYLPLDIKAWMHINPNPEPPKLSRFFREQAHDIFLRLRKENFGDDELYWEDNNGEWSVPVIESAMDNDIFLNIYPTLVQEGLCTAQVLIRYGRKLKYFEQLAYHLYIKTPSVNAESDLGIYVSHGGHDEQMQTLIFQEPFADTFRDYKIFVRELMEPFGVNIENLDSMLALPLQYSVDDSYGISAVTCLPYPDDFGANINAQRIILADSSSSMSEQIRQMRNEFHRFYTIDPLTQHQMKKARFEQWQIDNWNSI